MKDNIPQGMKTPMSTIMRALESIVFDDTHRTGLVLEASGGDVISKERPPYGNEATEYIVELRYRDLIDTAVLTSHGEERANARKEMDIMLA